MEPLSLQSDRMSDLEAQEVIKLLEERRQSREQVMSQPSISDVAQLANASEFEVAEALRDIRQHTIAASVTKPGETRNLRNFTIVIALLLIVTTGLIAAVRMIRTSPAPEDYAATEAAPQPVIEKTAEASLTTPALAGDSAPASPARSSNY